jgi:hypothetical protein
VISVLSVVKWIAELRLNVGLGLGEELVLESVEDRLKMGKDIFCGLTKEGR